MRKFIISSLTLLSCTAYAGESTIELRHRESGGVGYSLGYTSLDYFFNTQGDGTQLLVDLRAHLFNDARAAGNGGIGFRCPISSDKYMVGANAFYDFRQVSDLFANQVGSGLEFLSQNVDVRMNGYLPVGKKKHLETRKFDNFARNSVLIRRKLKATLPSIEAEIGTPLPKPCYFAFGSYYLFRQEAGGVKVGNAWGGKFRADFDLGKYVNLGLAITYDPIFHTRVQGILALHMSFGGKKQVKEQPKRNNKNKSKTVIEEPKKRNLRDVCIMRNEIIPVQDKKRSKDPLINSDDDPIQFLFVDNTADALLADGSFEKPFSSLKDAEARSKAGDVIYVFHGDGTPKNMDHGIVLKEDQILASSSAPLVVENIAIPPQTPGKPPVITNVNPNEPIVTNKGRNRLNDFIFIPAVDYVFGNWGFNPFGNGVNPPAPPVDQFAMARELGFEVVNAPAPIGNPPQGLISYIIDNYVPGAGGN